MFCIFVDGCGWALSNCFMQRKFNWLNVSPQNRHPVFRGYFPAVSDWTNERVFEVEAVLGATAVRSLSPFVSCFHIGTKWMVYAENSPNGLWNLSIGGSPWGPGHFLSEPQNGRPAVTAKRSNRKRTKLTQQGGTNTLDSKSSSLVILENKGGLAGIYTALTPSSMRFNTVEA